MSILQVLNVGQGDSMILRPESPCCFKGEIFVIDLGPGGTDITQHINSYEKVNIILTHHDNDHFGGFKFFVDRIKQIQKLIVPFHQNEITLIAKSILSLRGIRSAEDCGEFIRLLEDTVSNQMLLKSLSQYSTSQPIISFAYDGKDYCNHITCMNPPILTNTYDWLREMDEEDLASVIREIFIPAHAEIILRYIECARRGRGWQNVDARELYDIFLDDNKLDRDLELSQQDNVYRDKGNFVVNFFLQNLELIRKFNDRPIRKNLKKIYNNYATCAHDVCIVLRANYQENTFLLTGDASKKVFYRLLREGKKINADYLKVPHHGSKENLDEQILDNIAPKVAIISHDSRCFGKAKDPHPNMEVLTLLQKKHVRVLITNDVVKNGLIYMKKVNHQKDTNVDIM